MNRPKLSKSDPEKQLQALHQIAAPILHKHKNNLTGISQLIHNAFRVYDVLMDLRADGYKIMYVKEGEKPHEYNFR